MARGARIAGGPVHITAGGGGPGGGGGGDTEGVRGEVSLNRLDNGSRSVKAIYLLNA